MDNVISQLQSAGLIVDGMPDIGILRRCKVDGDTGRKESGWYILHELRLDNGDLVHVGRYGNWKTLGDESLAITFDKPLSSYDQDRIKKQTQLLREQADADKKLRALSAANRAKTIWGKLPETGASNYLKRKQVGAYGLRFSRGSIVIPVHNIAFDLVGLQFISGDGTKLFLTGTPKRGCFHLIGDLTPRAPLCICEGYATAASIYKATGWAVAVAFDAGNLTPVAKALHEKYPDQKIIVCADNDIKTLGNPGVARAREAAAAVGALVAIPAFPVEVAA